MRHVRLEIFNTDKGSHFTSVAFTAVMKDDKVCINLDSSGRWMENVFIERIWRSFKYECVYLQALQRGRNCGLG